MFNLVPTLRNRRLAPAAREFDNFVDRFFDEAPLFGGLSEFMPSIDVAETEDKLTVTAEAPGMEANDIDVSVDNGVLTIRGEKKMESEENKENYHRVERRYGAFSRALRLPAEVDPDKIEAKYVNGVLKLELPKSETAKKRRIEIKAN